MIGVDSNLPGHAHGVDAPWHDAAYAKLECLAKGTAAWAIPWPCLHELLANATHPRTHAPPTPLDAAPDQVDAWMGSPSLALLAEREGYREGCRSMLRTARAAGALVHDARIAGLCVQHGVTEPWTADWNFGRFPALAVHDPLVD